MARILRRRFLMKKTSAATFAAVLLAGLCTGCWTHHEIKTESEIKPVHITIDVNVKVDKALDDYFSDLDKASTEQ